MCVLRTISREDGFAGFLDATSLPAKRIRKKGQRRRSGKSDTWAYHHFRCDVSDASWEDLSTQIQDAINFLQTHGDEIDRLRISTPDVEICVDFPISCLLSDDRYTQTSTFPLELIDLLSKHRIGLDMTYYPPPDEKG